MLALKKIFGIVHLYMGLVSGLVVFVVAFTGTIYVFEEEIRDITQAGFFYVKAENKDKIAVSEVIRNVKKDFPKKRINQLRWRTDVSNASILIYTKDKNVLFYNPYTGKLIAERNLSDDWLSVALQIHKSLLLGETGEWIIKINVTIFLLMVISGLVLWYPANKLAIKSALSIKFGAKRKKVTYDLHSVLGFYASIILLIIALTGIFWVYESVEDAVYTITGSKATYKEKVKSKINSPKVTYPIDKIFETAQKEYPGYNYANLAFPNDSSASVRVVLRYPYKWVRSQNTLHFDQYSGKLLKADLYRNYSSADKIRVSNFDLHTGRIFGMLGKILYFLAGAFATSLPVTGFMIWLGKRNKRTKANKIISLESAKLNA